VCRGARWSSPLSLGRRTIREGRGRASRKNETEQKQNAGLGSAPTEERSDCFFLGSDQSSSTGPSPGGVARTALRAGGMAVEGYVEPHQAVALPRNTRRLYIAVVSGVRFAREGLAEILERDPLVSIVGLYTDLIEAVALRHILQADLVLVDARSPEGPNALRRALDIAPEMRGVAFAVRETEDDIVAWAEAGVIGYIPSTAALADLVRLVMDIDRGEQVCSARVAAGLLRRIALSASRGTGRYTTFLVPGLTARERLVAELLESGLSNKEIARRLSISLATTKSHVHSLLGKLNVRCRKQVTDYFCGYGGLH